MTTSRWYPRALVLALAVALAPSVAHAGRRPFIWAYDTTIVADGEMELEQWLWMRGRSEEANHGPSHYWIWWGPVFGIGDHLELNLPFEIASQPKYETWLADFQLDLRYRVKSRLNNDPFQTVIRASYVFPTSDFVPVPRFEADLINSYDLESGYHFVLDLGGRFGLAPITSQGGDASFQGTVDLGAAYSVTDELRVSGETFFEIPIANVKGTTHWFVGPSMEWTHGRFWITAGFLIGVTPALPQTPHIMPRVIWAVSL